MAFGGERLGRGAWPARLEHGRVTLRPITYRDGTAWRELRTRNAAWLRPWEATQPDGGGEGVPFWRWVRLLHAEAAAGRMLPFVVTYDGILVGQLTVGGISLGSLRSGYVGYWIDERMAGRGIIPTAVALAVDHCFTTAALHRIEVNIRPENVASRRVVEKLGLREEGVRPRYLHIDGAWRDHLSYAVTIEEVPEGLLPRLFGS